MSVAKLGGVGLNFHGGGNGRYSPIAGDRATGYQARPEFYGLLLAQNFAGRSLLAASVTAPGGNLTAYAAGVRGKPELVALVNKDSRDVDVAIAGLTSPTGAAAMRLTAPDLTSKQAITLGNPGKQPGAEQRILSVELEPAGKGKFELGRAASGWVLRGIAAPWLIARGRLGSTAANGETAEFSSDGSAIRHCTGRALCNAQPGAMTPRPYVVI